MTNTDNRPAGTALTQLAEKMRSKTGGGLNKQVGWLTDGYSLGYLTADEAKTRFCQLIDELEQGKG